MNIFRFFGWLRRRRGASIVTAANEDELATMTGGPLEIVVVNGKLFDVRGRSPRQVTPEEATAIMNAAGGGVIYEIVESE